jgi:hypothetical protein
LAILENFRKKRCKISHFDGEWCNGSTTDSDSVCLGSNPSSPANNNQLKLLYIFEKVRPPTSFSMLRLCRTTLIDF